MEQTTMLSFATLIMIFSELFFIKKNNPRNIATSMTDAMMGVLAVVMAIIATIMITFITFIELISGGTFIILIMITTSAIALLITIITICEVLFPGNPLDHYIYKGLSVFLFSTLILTAIFL